MKNHPLANVNIKIIKLSNSEEIISLVNRVEKDNIVLESPMLLNVVISDYDKYTYYLTNWMPMSNDQIINVSINNIIAYSNVNNSIKENYVRASLSFKDSATERNDYFDDTYDDDTYDDDDEEDSILNNKIIH